MHLRSHAPVRSVLIACLAASLSAAAASAQATSHLQPIAQHDRIPSHADLAPLSQLSQQLPSWANPGQQSSAHAIDLSSTIKISVVLRRDPAVQAAFERFLADQQTPGSPLYHQWLTPEQVGQLFGPTQNDIAAVTTWLTSQGLKLESVAPSGVLVRASGSIAVVGNALHTSFASFTIPGDLPGAAHLSAVSEPSIPSALTPLVLSIQGLAELPLRPMVRSTAVKGLPTSASSGAPSGLHPEFTNSTTHYLTPGDFAIIFDINSTYNAGNNGATIGGKTQRVAVIGESRVVNTDITEYENLTGLPAVTPTVVVPPSAVDPGTTNTSAQDEATLDVDRVVGTAPGAAIDLVIAQDTATASGIFEAIQYNIDTLLDPVMTISFGACESAAGLSNVQYVDNLGSTAAAEGITTLVSSGDSGVAGCDTSFKQAPTTQIASINFLCSSTYVTCVGGTEFNDTANASTYWASTNSTGLISALSYIPEGAWNEPSYLTASNTTAYAPASTGGGVSTFISKPSWQTGTGVPSGSFRDVPDVSFPAASHDGYFACLAYDGGNCANNFFEDFSGTSAAAPGMAGVVALLNTRLGSAQGNINPLLYSIATSTPAAFHDATIATSGVSNCSSATPSLCNNSTPGPTTLTGGLAGFDLTPGFDLATGLGSLDVGAFLTASSTTTTLLSTTLALTAASNPIAAGASTTFTATLTPSTGSTVSPTGTVQFYSNGAAIGSAINLSGNTATSAATAFSAAGTYAITATYSGDGVYAASTSTALQLVVTAASSGNFTLAASAFNPSTVTPTPSTNGTPVIGTATSTITATSTGSFTGSIALTCAVTPATGAPPACTVSSPVNLTANGTVTSTVTVSYAGPTSNCLTNVGSTHHPISGASLGSAALALLLLLLPVHKRKSLRNLACIVLLTAGLAALSGCGGNSTTGGGGGVCSEAIGAGTTAGTYTVTVTGTSGSITTTATSTLTVN